MPNLTPQLAAMSTQELTQLLDDEDKYCAYVRREAAKAHIIKVWPLAPSEGPEVIWQRTPHCVLCIAPLSVMGLRNGPGLLSLHMPFHSSTVSDVIILHLPASILAGASATQEGER